MIDGMGTEEIRKLKNKLTREYDYNMAVIEYALSNAIDYECHICEKVTENHTGIPDGWKTILDKGRMYVLCEVCHVKYENLGKE